MSRSPETRTYFGRCRCCLEYGYLKNMWEEYQWEAEKEIYVEMLVQCFALSWELAEESKHLDQICEACIVRLRDANNFKKTILESQETLLGNIDEEAKESNFKIEKAEYLYQEDSENDALATTSIYLEELDETRNFDSDDPDYVALKDSDDDYNFQDIAISNDGETDMKYEEVEYLDIEDNQEALAEQNMKSVPERHNKSPAKAQPTGKWPKKLPKSERYKTYKQYTEEDLRKCLAAVRNEEMTPGEAAKKFNIPKKTIFAKAKIDPNEHETIYFDEKSVNKDKMYQMIQEVKTILIYTNGTPYKSNGNRFFCAYCSTDNPEYMEPEDLRAHTRTRHITDRTLKIEYALRPHWMNETVKLDIENLICNVCCISITSWNDMFRHLKKQHNIVLDQAYTKVIPYVLTSEVHHCALCKEEFVNYMQLDGHMNAHYNNYVCEDCGATFLAENRLKQHKKIHIVGRFYCDYCSKFFSLERYKKKHIELVHKHAAKFKCWYCDSKFSGEYLRHLHVVDEHKEKVKPITCELCGKSFTWRPYYMTHMKKNHTEDAKVYKCEECDKQFFLPYELKVHMLRHNGEKYFACGQCSKRFVSSGSLRHHYNWHRKQLEASVSTS